MTAAPSAGDVHLLPKVLDAAERFRPLDPQEQEALVRAGHTPAAAAVPEPLFAALMETCRR